MSKYEIIKPGTIIKFIGLFSKLSGVIKSVNISEAGIVYEVCYFNADTFTTAYIPREMFYVGEDDQSSSVGFIIVK